MPADNVERIRVLLDAWNRRDLDTMLAGCAHDVEYVNSPDAVEPGTRHGHEGFADVLAKQWDLLGDGAMQETEDLHAVGADQVLFVGRITRTMPGSDATIDARGVLRWTLNDEGLLTRVEVLGAGSSFQAGLDRARAES